MTSQKNLDDIKNIIHISSIDKPWCQFCEGEWERKLNDFDHAVNHYMEKHGYKLLHIGSETHQKESGDIFNCTVAVLGK